MLFRSRIYLFTKELEWYLEGHRIFYQYRMELTSGVQFFPLDIRDFTINPEGNLYFIQARNNHILKMTEFAGTKEFYAINTSSDVFEGLIQPESLFYSDGNLYVLDCYGKNERRIVRLSENGNYHWQIVFEPAREINRIRLVGVENSSLILQVNDRLLQIPLSELGISQDETGNDSINLS